MMPNQSNEKVDPSVILPILKQIPLFSGLDENENLEVINHIVLMYYPSNYMIFNKGDQGDALYIVKKGQVEVFEPSENENEPPNKIADIGEGGFFGEMALISDSPRMASIKTVGECEIFILSKQDFQELMNTNKALAEQISAAIIARIKDNSQRNQ